MTRATPALLSLALLACGGQSSANEPAVVGPTRDSGDEAAAFGFDEALAAARERMPDALPIEVEHETVDGADLVEVELIVGDAVRELYFDPRTGELAREGDEELSEDEQAALPGLRDAVAGRDGALEEAIALARREHPDAALREIELVLADGQLVVEVEIDLDGAAQSHRHPLGGTEASRGTRSSGTVQASPDDSMQDEELIE